jgi:2-oxoglutarate dehydrogenase E1 component
VDDHFQPVLDEDAEIDAPQKVLFCSGKIYYDLLMRQRELELDTMVLVRIEQLYPFAQDHLNQVIQKYANARQWCWVQEEPENMGAWRFMRPRLEALIGAGVTYIGRSAASSPATGFPAIYNQEKSDILARAVGRAPSSGEAAAAS